MDVSITNVPAWLSVLFVISFSTIPIFLISNTVKTVLKHEDAKSYSKLPKRIIGFYALYFLATALLSLNGFFAENSLPPKIIITTACPLLFFYFIYVKKTSWFKFVFNRITLEQLIFIHSFRFVGVFFILVYFYDALPKNFALTGGIGDIVTALLIFPVIYALKKNKRYAIALAWAWNVFGLIDIITVIVTAILITKKAISHNMLGVEEFGTFPFSWIPAFAPATIIFLHLLIFTKLKTNTDPHEFQG